MASNNLSDEDTRVLRLWRENLVLQDPRYRSKGLLAIAAMAVADEHFRSRLVNDTEALLSELPSTLDLPEGVALKFFDNTQNTLFVVLPPQAGVMDNKPQALRDVLRSRTADALSFGSDDFDFGNLTDSGPAPGHADGGDPDSRDGPIFVTS